MPADATTILGAVKTILAALYPSIPVRTSKRPAAGAKPEAGGVAPGYPPTCIVVSCSDPEEVDRAGFFDYLTVGNVVTVSYVKPAQEAVAGAVDAGHPARVVEDPDVRDKRAAIRGALYKNRLSGTSVFHCVAGSKPVYEEPGSGGAVSLVSEESFAYLATEARP